MKPEHRQILDKLEDYLNHPGAEHLRFWQALYNMDVVVFDKSTPDNEPFTIKDDHNISDKALLKRIKYHV